MVKFWVELRYSDGRARVVSLDDYADLDVSVIADTVPVSVVVEVPGGSRFELNDRDARRVRHGARRCQTPSGGRWPAP